MTPETYTQFQGYVRDINPFATQLLREIVLNDILQKDAEDILYWEGKKVATQFPIPTLLGIQEFFKDAGWGDLEMTSQQLTQQSWTLTGPEVIDRFLMNVDPSFALEAGFLAQQLEQTLNKIAEGTFKLVNNEKVEFTIQASESIPSGEESPAAKQFRDSILPEQTLETNIAPSSSAAILVNEAGTKQETEPHQVDENSDSQSNENSQEKPELSNSQVDEATITPDESNTTINNSESFSNNSLEPSSLFSTENSTDDEASSLIQDNANDEFVNSDNTQIPQNNNAVVEEKSNEQVTENNVDDLINEANQLFTNNNVNSTTNANEKTSISTGEKESPVEAKSKSSSFTNRFKKFFGTDRKAVTKNSAEVSRENDPRPVQNNVAQQFNSEVTNESVQNENSQTIVNDSFFQADTSPILDEDVTKPAIQQRLESSQNAFENKVLNEKKSSLEEKTDNLTNDPVYAEYFDERNKEVAQTIQNLDETSYKPADEYGKNGENNPFNVQMDNPDLIDRLSQKNPFD